MAWFMILFPWLKKDKTTLPEAESKKISHPISTTVGLNTGGSVLTSSETMCPAPPLTLAECQIFKWLQTGEFWTKLPSFRTEILPEIKKEFGTELEHLKTAYADRKGAGVNTRPFGLDLYPGEELAGTYYEIDRTLTALHALFWIQNDQKDVFNEELNVDEWNWIRQQFQTSEANIFLPENAELCYALITSVITNDVGKSVEIAKAYSAYTKSDIDISEQNHDTRLKTVVEAGMIPSYTRLSKDLQQDLMLGINVAAECNLGQIAQAENVAASVYPLKRFVGRARAWRLRFMEQILDLAGAQGHIDNAKALIFGKAIAQGNRSSRTAAEDVIFHNKSPQTAWEGNVLRKYEYIVEFCGYTLPENIGDSERRALTRLFCIGGIGNVKPKADPNGQLRSDSTAFKQEMVRTNRELAELYEEVLLRSPATADFRHEFITVLNRNGLSQPTVQITYLPAMCSGAVNLPWGNRDAKMMALAAVFRWANNAMRLDAAAIAYWKRQFVTVVEIDAFELTQFIKGSPAEPSRFFENPAALGEQVTPKRHAGNQVEPGSEEDFYAV